MIGDLEVERLLAECVDIGVIEVKITKAALYLKIPFETVGSPICIIDIGLGAIRVIKNDRMLQQNRVKIQARKDLLRGPVPKFHLGNLCGFRDECRSDTKVFDTRSP